MRFSGGWAWRDNRGRVCGCVRTVSGVVVVRVQEGLLVSFGIAPRCLTRICEQWNLISSIGKTNGISGVIMSTIDPFLTRYVVICLCTHVISSSGIIAWQRFSILDWQVLFLPVICLKWWRFRNSRIPCCAAHWGIRTISVSFTCWFFWH